MQDLKILNSREIKNIHALLKKSFGYEKKLDYAFLVNNKDRIYITNREFSNIDFSKLRINSIGLYFGEIPNQKEIRLSIEGSQIIGKDCTKNILELDAETARLWLKGEDLDVENKEREFYIIKHEEDFLGCGKVVDNKLLNYIPKNRRIKSSD